MTSLTDVDPFDPEVVADPYPWFQRLLETGPIHWLPARDLWIAVGYDVVGSLLRDPSVFSSSLGYRAMSAGALSPDGRDTTSLFDLDVQSLRTLINTDPPDHTRIRRLLSRAFTPRTIAELEPRLRATCREMVAQLAEKAADGSADLVTDLAIPFPVTVIAELLDIPIERRGDFRRWSDALAGTVTGGMGMEEAMTAGAELFGFMAEVVEARTVDPGADLISRLITGSAEEADPLTFEEIIVISIVLLAAGNETTTNLIGNAVDAFARHPDQAERVWEEPDLVPAALEEVLRWQSPVQGLPRATTQATSLGSADLPAGAPVLVCFAAANRDPNHFEDPGRFDIDRRPGDHFAFGHGAHFCLGASLARLEARLAFEALIEAGIQPEPADGAERTSGFLLRGFTKYPLVGSQPTSA